MTDQIKTACFGAGCFWGIQQKFHRIPGVVDTRVGYSGGHKSHPTYKEVCTGTTNHAEVCEVQYDEMKVSFDDLLEAFWQMHDPTTPNRQGSDYGSQYRSAIYYYSEDQKNLAMASIEKWNRSGQWRKPIVTEMTAMSDFWVAEDYHQHYLAKRGL